jgi:Protein kinase domain
MEFKSIVLDLDSKYRQIIQNSYGGKRALKFVNPNLFVIEKLGSGVFGQVFLAIDNQNYKYALKFQTTNLVDVKYEFSMHVEFAKHNLAAKVHCFDYWGKSYSLIIMDYVEFMLKDYLAIRRSKKQLNHVILEINTLIDKMCQFNLRHNDLHWENLGWVNNHVIVFDFGYASKAACSPMSEYFVLAATMWIITNEFNRNYLFHYFWAVLENVLKNNNISIPENLEDIFKYDMYEKTVFPFRPKEEEKQDAKIVKCKTKKNQK